MAAGVLCGEFERIRMGNRPIENEQQNRDLSIQVIRVIAMFMIIFDHILCNISFTLQPVVIQVLNSGVYIFVFISGLLFGDKRVTDWKKWFISRLKKIIIPLWIFAIVDLIVEQILWGNFEVKNIFIYMFNLQGIFSSTIGAINLWFVTLIMICYLFNPLFQYIKEKKVNLNIIIICAIIFQIIMAYATDIGLLNGHNISWCILALIVYFVGYLIGVDGIKTIITKKSIFIVLVVTIVASVLVVICRMKIDGSVLYNRLIMPYGMIMVDMTIVFVLYSLSKNIRNIALRGIIKFFDSISYEFYIVHGLIISALTNEWLGKYGVLVYILGTVLISIFTAVILSYVIRMISYLKRGNNHEKDRLSL